MNLCYIGLGSNLEDPEAQVTTALQELSAIPDTKMLGQSVLYRSDPVGPAGQPDYINAVAAIETQLEPEVLLDHLQAIETAHERKRLVRWGPRTLDLDLLLYGSETIQSDRLTVPHPEIPNRAFVLYPLAELNPELRFPDGKPLRELLDQCSMGTLEPIAI